MCYGLRGHDRRWGGVFDLDIVPDVLGLCGWRPDATVVSVLQGHDARSVCALIPDPQVLERGFYVATIVDMEDTVEPAVSEADLSLLRPQWPVTVVQSMTCMVCTLLLKSATDTSVT